MDKDRFKEICTKTQDELFDYLKRYLKNPIYEPSKMFLYQEGNLPVLLLAHMDTVFPIPPTLDQIVEKKNRITTKNVGLGADDRAGVEMILEFLDEGLSPHILFLKDEEIGTVGAYYFVRSTIIPKVNVVFGIDAYDTHVAVPYGCTNEKFFEYIERYNYQIIKEVFSDVKTICPHLGIAGATLSCGYHKFHTPQEYLDIEEFEICKNNIRNMILDYPKEKMEYGELTPQFTEPLHEFDLYWT